MMPDQRSHSNNKIDHIILHQSCSRITLPKMRASIVLAASASLLSSVHARIFGIGIPSTIKPGDTFDLIIEAQDYIQSVTDVAIAVGYSLGSVPAADGLGTFITAFDLGNVYLFRLYSVLKARHANSLCVHYTVDDSNLAITYNETVTLPATALTGIAIFTASLTTLYGAQYEPALVPFRVLFIIGKSTSTTYLYAGL